MQTFKVFNRNGFLEQFSTSKEAYEWCRRTERFHPEHGPFWVEEE